ncbi:stage II sporulation protein D [Cohnella hongkongensis]|uniref:Stage II sporulation protein D n=1 Tax=Cohnella hongkongensis TaxID=178337 RepID=A0ABV9FG48_9BACL
MRGRRYGRKGWGRRRRRGQIAVSWKVIAVAYATGCLLAVWLWQAVHGGAAPGMAVAEGPALEEREPRLVSPAGIENETDGEESGTKRMAGTGGQGGEGRKAGAEKREEKSEGKREEKGEEKREEKGAEPADAQLKISIYVTKTGKVETVPLEMYVAGVVAAEMPLGFRPAALEAQAIAARTYAVRRLWLGERAGKADVTDTQEHQVYLSVEEMKRLRENDGEGWEKARDAAARTEGQILVYGDEPIEALFFSTSNGYTENSEEVFSVRRPYLRSVRSPWDQAISERAKETIEFGLAEFYEKLGVETVPAARGEETAGIRVLERTEGRRIKTLLAGDRRFSGTEVRRLLGLRSASFDWKAEGGRLTLTVYGYGHGVGMSQWGAEGMAREGYGASQILAHYYTGARLEQVSKLAIGAEKRL